MRRVTAIALLLAATIGLGAQAAEAAPPPTLAGVFASESTLYGPTALACRTNADGGVNARFRYPTNTTSGPYAGQLTQDIDFTLGRPDPDFQERQVLSATGSFTIDSPTGQVSGTVSLDRSGSQNVGRADCDPSVQYVYATLRYSATIVTADGIFVDRGRIRFDLSQLQPNNPFYNYLQSFGSDLAAPEQNESALFGQRTPGGSFSAMSANTNRASPFTLFAPATVRKVFAYVDGKGATSGSQTIRAVLYRNAGGVPAAYVTRSFDFTVPAGMSARWVPLYLAPPAQLGPGVYWIGLQSGTTNGVARFAWNSKPNSRRFNVDGFADGASDPFGSALVDDQQMSLLAAGSY